MMVAVRVDGTLGDPIPDDHDTDDAQARDGPLHRGAVRGAPE